MNWEDFYNSDMNAFHRFVNKFCSSEMTATDIDCFFVKVAQKRLRFIESKHTTEGMKKGQKIALTILSEITHPNYTLECFIVRGEYPYTKATVEDMQGNSWELNQRDLILWLNFEIELEQIQETQQYSELGELF